MKQNTRFQLFSLVMLVSLFTALSGIAQTHTPKYVSMTSKTKAYYEYLPEGYDPNGTATYPLLLFITGIGEFGDGTAAQLPYVLKNGVPKLIEAGTFPKSFTVNSQTHRFIVITPQFLKGSYPKAVDIDAVLNYVVAKYKVNTTRIYITGLSYGGGSAWGYPGENATYAKRIAATVPVAGAVPTGGDSVIYLRSRVIAANNVAVWAFHNSGDQDTPVATTNSYVTYINQAPAPTPLARKTIFNIGGHDAWTKAYDPLYKENNLNIYEWMLQYQRPPQVVAKKIQVNVYGGTNAYTDVSWNNWNVGTASATNVSSTAFKYSDGATSTVSATLSATSAVSDNGSTYGSGMAPAPVLRYTSNSTVLRTLTLNGLSTSKTYNLEFYASRSTSTAGNTVFTVNGTPITVNVVNNVTNKAAFNNIAPNASGQIVVSINKTATYNYLNGFAVTENAATPPPGGKYVKVNVYGGANAYANAEWNNWNVGTVSASNKSISSLKYSDGAVSTISATLSATSAVSDNGTAYGSGMAPAEVLRYTSNSTVLRTLTIGGLATSKKYTIELYASRSTSTAGSTVYTVNSVSQTVNAVNNLTNKATFSNLTPNASGQIVVSINKTATYNYLNGFTITEASGSTTTSIKAASISGSEQIIAANRSFISNGPAVSIFPNPATSNMLLSLNNAYTGTLQVQIADVTGRSRKEFRFVKSSAIMQQSLPVADLSKGMYFITVQTGTQRQTIKVFKL